jgi:hypothetical protein
MHGAPLRQVARQASLSPQRLRQALRWNAWRPNRPGSYPAANRHPYGHLPVLARTDRGRGASWLNIDDERTRGPRVRLAGSELTAICPDLQHRMPYTPPTR